MVLVDHTLSPRIEFFCVLLRVAIIYVKGERQDFLSFLKTVFILVLMESFITVIRIQQSVIPTPLLQILMAIHWQLAEKLATRLQELTK